MNSVSLHKKALMSHASFFASLPCGLGRGRGHPLVRTADAPAIHAVTAPPRRIRPADASLSLGCGTRCTADADGSARPGSPRPVRSTRVGTTADGLPRWPDGRTARTTASCRGRPCGCAASVCRRQRRHVTHGPHWPRAHARCSVHAARVRRSRGRPISGSFK